MLWHGDNPSCMCCLQMKISCKEQLQNVDFLLMTCTSLGTRKGNFILSPIVEFIQCLK
jgi:hypothetical protein